MFRTFGVNGHELLRWTATNSWGERPRTSGVNGHELLGWTATNFWGERPVQKWLVLKCVFNVFSGWDTLENAFLPSNSPQIELSTISSSSSCLKVEKNNFSHQKNDVFDHSICNNFFKVHLRSNLSRNLTYLRQIWVLFNKTISKIFGRSPQKLVAVHPRSSWPFTP